MKGDGILKREDKLVLEIESSGCDELNVACRVVISLLLFGSQLAIHVQDSTA